MLTLEPLPFASLPPLRSSHHFISTYTLSTVIKLRITSIIIMGIHPFSHPNTYYNPSSPLSCPTRCLCPTCYLILILFHTLLLSHAPAVSVPQAVSVLHAISVPLVLTGCPVSHTHTLLLPHMLSWLSV